ncbi:sigma-70 family RNA polymerase sigma factor [Alkalibacterium kapii]|uniref:DNA-directed RNA polymerase sigma-70 factor n=1 Tax=Alkalibacterium kapii TaxID=426704 RepID=A0A511AS05_9LACT|nr:sigma-70 family RNA polymerase sigma factor [Alkalibacterium kapii]GEK90975.1 hypothetical protein AKA01nite_05970 [Alkalibacterium kapii]
MNKSIERRKVESYKALYKLTEKIFGLEDKMKRQLTDELATDFLFVHESLVYGVLKACHVGYTQAYYDDYVQIGRLNLIQAYEVFPEDLREEQNYYRFTGFAYQRVRWAILDELRKAAKERERESGVIDTSVFEAPMSNDRSEESVVYWELFQSMFACLNEQEKEYLEDAVILRLNVSAMAKKYGVSRKTVYQWKQRVGKKLAHFRKDLDVN